MALADTSEFLRESWWQTRAALSVFALCAEQPTVRVDKTSFSIFVFRPPPAQFSLQECDAEEEVRAECGLQYEATEGKEETQL